MKVAAMLAVVAAAVAMAAAAALTSGGDCGGRGIMKVESSKGGMVLHLQASGVSIQRGMVDEPTEEGAGEGERGYCH